MKSRSKNAPTSVHIHTFVFEQDLDSIVVSFSYREAQGRAVVLVQQVRISELARQQAPYDPQITPERRIVQWRSLAVVNTVDVEKLIG